MTALLANAINGFYHWLGTYNLSLAFLVLMMYLMAAYMLYRCLRRLRFLAVLTFSLQAVLTTMATLVLTGRVLVIPAFEALFIVGGILLPAGFILADFIGMRRRVRVSGGPVPLVEKLEKRPGVELEGDWALRADAPGPLYPAAVVGRNLHSTDETVLVKAREQLAEAETLLAEGDLKAAEGIYAFLSRLIALDARGLCNAAWLKHRTGDQEEAVRLFRKAQSLARKEGTAEGTAAEEAAPELSASAKVVPELSTSAKAVSELAASANAPDGAPEGPHANRRGMHRRGTAMSSDPYRFAGFGIACAQFANRSWEDALFSFQKVLVKGGASAPLYRNLARCHLFLDCADKAREELEQALALEDTPDTRLALARLFEKLSLREGAVAQLEHLTLTERDMPEPWRMLGEMYRRESDWSRAEACFIQLVKLLPEDADAWFRLGSCRRHLGKQEEALSSYRVAIRIRPDHSRALYGAAAIHEARGEDKEAISLLRQAIAGDEPMEKSYNLLASIYQGEGRIREAVAVYLEAVARFPEDGLLQANLGAAQVMAGFHDRAIKPFKAAVRLGENDPSLYTMWVKSLFELKHAHDAVRVLKEACAAYPEDAGLRYLSARAKARCHDTEGAIGDLEAAVAMDADLRLDARACGDFAAIRTAPGFINLIRLPLRTERT